VTRAGHPGAPRRNGFRAVSTIDPAAGTQAPGAGFEKWKDGITNPVPR
jgi:hypothetical protein